jgi:hypothetical protein
MRDLLKNVDRNLFINLIDRKLTLDQFKTRVFEKIQKKTEDEKYYCLDDLKQIIGDQLLNFDPVHVEEYIKMIHKKDPKDLTAKEATQPLEPWQTNQKCLRSLYNLGVKVPSLNQKRRKRKSQELP